MNQAEYMTVGEAMRELGVSKSKITRLLNDGTLPSEINMLDKRSKLIKRADVEALKRRGKPEQAPRKNAA